MFSTSEESHDSCGGYHEYIGGCLTHGRNVVILVGGYHEYIGRVQYIGARDIMIHFEDQIDKSL